MARKYINNQESELIISLINSASLTGRAAHVADGLLLKLTESAISSAVNTNRSVHTNRLLNTNSLDTKPTGIDFDSINWDEVNAKLAELDNKLSTDSI